MKVVKAVSKRNFLNKQKIQTNKKKKKEEEEQEEQEEQEEEEEEKEEFEEMDIKLTPKQAVATFRDSPFLFFYGGCYDNSSATNVDV